MGLPVPPPFDVEASAWEARTSASRTLTLASDFVRDCRFLGVRQLELCSPSDLTMPSPASLRAICVCLAALAARSRDLGLRTPAFPLAALAFPSEDARSRRETYLGSAEPASAREGTPAPVLFPPSASSRYAASAASPEGSPGPPTPPSLAAELRTPVASAPLEPAPESPVSPSAYSRRLLLLAPPPPLSLADAPCEGPSNEEPVAKAPGRTRRVGGVLRSCGRLVLRGATLCAAGLALAAAAAAAERRMQPTQRSSDGAPLVLWAPVQVSRARRGKAV